MIFCFPVEDQSLARASVFCDKKCLTVSAGLDRSFNVADTLNRHAVLVVAVYHLVLKLANLVDQDTKLIGNIRDIIVTCLTPN